MENIKPVRSKTTEMTIRNAKYIVTTTFDENASQTVGDKLVRYLAQRISSDLNNSDTQPTAGKNPLAM